MVSETQNAPDTSVQKVEKEPVHSAYSVPKWQLPLLLIVAPLLLLALYGKLTYAGLINTDALDFAQLGHNISSGRGMVTYVLRPLALTHGSNLLRQPDVTHGPLYPFLLALAFGALKASDGVVSGVSALFYLLTIPLIYMLGLRVFNRTVGLLSAAAFAYSGLVLQYAVSGLPITLYTFLVTALFLALYNLSAGKAGQVEQQEAPLSTKLLALTGVLSGLLYLTEPIFVWLLPVVGLAVLQICGPKRRAAALKFVLPLGIVILPWMARNLIVTGNPVFGLRGAELWMNTVHHFPGHEGYARFDEEFPRGPYLIPSVIKKALMGLNSVFRTLPQISGAWILAFLLPCLLFGYSSRSATLLRRTAVLSALALLGGMLLFQADMPLLCCLVPTMLVFSIAYLTHLVRQAKLSPTANWALTAFLGFTVIYPLISQVAFEERMHGFPERESALAMSRMVPAQEGVFSDRPETVAWYADRPAILIPVVDTRITDIRTQFPNTRWMLLTPAARVQSSQWQALYDQCARWNNLYAQAQMSNVEVPSQIRITAADQPLFKALTGFTSVAPVRNASLSTVIAVLPETKLSMGSDPAQQPAP